MNTTSISYGKLRGESVKFDEVNFFDGTRMLLINPFIGFDEA